MEKETTKLSQEERLSVKIEEILTLVNSDPNPEELETIKKLIKKRVPFTRRGYFTAMLLKMLVNTRQDRGERFDRKKSIEKSKPAFDRKKEKTSDKQENEKETEAKTERVLPEGAKTLYLNVGKMKHLYGKDLSKLLQSELAITRDDIFALRVHDKYSFITMSEDNCNKAIEKLNGKEINGRVAQINFSNR